MRFMFDDGRRNANDYNIHVGLGNHRYTFSFRAAVSTRSRSRSRSPPKPKLKKSQTQSSKKSQRSKRDVKSKPDMKSKKARSAPIGPDCYAGYAAAFCGDSKKTCCVDVWPLNGVIKRRQFIKNVLKGQLRYLRPLSQLVSSSFSFSNSSSSNDNSNEPEPEPEPLFASEWDKCVKLMVLDLKDASRGYGDRASIAKHETEVAEFFTAQNRARIRKNAEQQKEMHDLVRSKLDIDYLLREGSLKHDLLHSNIFSADQVAYLSDPKQGGKDLCQLCELIMNGFKTFKQVELATCEGQGEILFHPKDYFIQIHDSNSNVGGETETETEPESATAPAPELITFYPDCYLSVYSKESPYFKCLGTIRVLRKSHIVFADFANITCIQMAQR